MMQPRCLHSPAGLACLAGAFLVGLLLCLPAPARASSAPPGGPAQAGRPSAPVVVAGLSSYFAGLANRHRVIQGAAVAMCLALFILLKRFASSQESGIRSQESGVSRQTASHP
jgi:hypothetical protein